MTKVIFEEGSLQGLIKAMKAMRTTLAVQLQKLQLEAEPLQSIARLRYRQEVRRITHAMTSYNHLEQFPVKLLGTVIDGAFLERTLSYHKGATIRLERMEDGVTLYYNKKGTGGSDVKGAAFFYDISEQYKGFEEIPTITLEGVTE